MKKRRLLNTLALLLVIGYGVGMSMIYAQKEETRGQTTTKIVVKDSLQAQFITPQKLKKRLQDQGIQIDADTLDYQKLERLIDSISYVREVEIYKTIQGDQVIELSQYVPRLRVVTSTGYDFYLDTLGNILPPPQNYYYETPVVTGSLEFEFKSEEYIEGCEKNGANDAIFLKKLTNFVNYTLGDEFLSNLITQIDVDQKRNIVLIPRFEDQEILLGELDEIEEKLSKLKMFYAHLFKKGGWQEISTIDLRYNQQVVVKKKNQTKNT